MKKRNILLIAALAVCVGLCVWFLNASICIGRIENRTEEQWSQLHVYMNEEITVDFPLPEGKRTCLFQYETGRGSFSVKITDAKGNILHSDTTSETGSIAFEADSDLKLWIKGDGHGGVFSLLQREEPVYHIGQEVNLGLLLDGTHSGGEFTATYDLRKADGNFLNFFVENRGNEPVIISINGEYDRTILPGESGHTSAPISVTVMTQPMTVKCISASGDNIDIYWKVAQRTKTSG